MDGYWEDGRYVLASMMKEKILRYEKTLFELGAMRNPPCFKCGYNGEGYYQADSHPCAELHHKLCKSDYC